MPSGVYPRTEEHRALCRKARAASSGSKGKHWKLDDDKKRYGFVPKSAFKKGHKTWNTGEENPWTEEHIAAIKKANTGRTPWNKGKKVPEMAGENNPNWGGGTTAQNSMDRVKFRKYYQQKILERDNYTCQVCDQYSGSLQVDHIKSWKDYPELRFNIDNCRTLCMACHYYITFKRKMPEGIVWGHNLKQRIT